MRIAALFVSAVALLSACYNPKYGNNADAGMAFRCYASDNPSCPSGLVCCIDRLCGEELLAQKPNEEGWCVTQPEPQDLSVTPLDFWEFGTKGTYYTGAVMDPGLTGTDPDTGAWRCHRDDLNPNPTDKEVLRAFEPNDTMDKAIGLTNPIPVDPPATMTGTSYEICPDKSAPGVPDVDVFRFRITSPMKVIAEVKYKVGFGDLDVAIFREMVDEETGRPQRVLGDLTAVDNACIEINNLPAGRYFVVVRGTNTPDKPSVYTMNNYQIRVYGVQSSGATCMPKKPDGGV